MPRVARCIPNAVVDDVVEPQHYRVTVPVRFGFLRMTYAANIHVSERDDRLHTAELDVTGKQLLGGGEVSAHVKVVAERRGEKTHVSLESEAELGGLLGTIGRPILEGVAGRTLAEFAKKVETLIP